MELTRVDVVHYAFIIGSILSGVLLERVAASFGNTTVVVAAMVLGLFWLVYYKYSIVPRLEHARHHSG